MRIAVIIVRVLLGLMFLFASVSYFLNLFEAPPMEGDVKKFNEGMAASGYLFQLVKAIELICGLAFLTGFFVPLAAVVILPITVNIFLFHAFLGPEGLPLATALLLGNVFLLYAKRKHYTAIFAS